VDYELANLSRHVFPSQPTLGMQAAMAFWNNGYAPENLRWFFSSLLKSYIRQIMASASDVCHLSGRSESVALAMSRDRGVVQFLTKQTQARADPTIQTFKVVEVDIQFKLVREMGVMTWCMDAVFPHGIIWQSVGPRQVIGISPSRSHVYHGKWPERDDYALPMHMQQLLVGSGGSLLPPAWALVNKDGATYCVSSWHPAIKVGIFKLTSSEAQCEAHTSRFNVPRSLSFLGPAITSLMYRGDSWFLLRVDAVDAFAMVVLGPDFQLKAYTPPFTLEDDMVREGNGEERALGFYIVMSRDRKEKVVFAYTSRGDVVIKLLPVETLLTLMT